jgi:hypothetical protein
LGLLAWILSAPGDVGLGFGLCEHRLAMFGRSRLRRGRRYAAPIEQEREGGCDGDFTPAAIDLLVPSQSVGHGDKAFGPGRASALDLALRERTDSSHCRAVLESLLPLEQEHTLQ